MNGFFVRIIDFFVFAYFVLNREKSNHKINHKLQKDKIDWVLQRKKPQVCGFLIQNPRFMKLDGIDFKSSNISAHWKCIFNIEE